MKRFIPVLILSALLLTGCKGSDSSSAKSTAEPANVVTTAIEEDTAAAAETTATAPDTSAETTTAKAGGSGEKTELPELTMTDDETTATQSAVRTELDSNKTTEKAAEITTARSSDEGAIELPIIPI